MQTTVQQTIRLHKVQRDFRRSKAIYKGFVGGRGSGKSWIGAYDMIRRAEPGRTYLVASPTASKMGDETFPTLKAIAEELEVWDYNSVKLTPYPTAKLTTGATIRFRSADKPDSLRGPNLSGIWLDEASLMEEDAFKIVIGCLREKQAQGWLSATFTPQGKSHWTYERFATGKPNTELFHCHTKDNPFNPAGFADTLALSYYGAWAQQELGGLFVSMEGAEWPGEWFDGIMFDDWPADVGNMLRVMALDPSKGKADRSGDYSAWIMLAVDSTTAPETLWVDADLSNTRHTNPSRDNSHSIVGDGYELMIGFRPAGVLIETNGFQQLVAEAFYQYCSERQMLGIPIYTRDSTENKEQRIRTLGTYFGQRRVRIKNMPGGRLLIQMLRDFRPKPHPDGYHDDGPDALKLAEVLAEFLLYGEGAITSGRAPQVLTV